MNYAATVGEVIGGAGIKLLLPDVRRWYGGLTRIVLYHMI